MRGRKVEEYQRAKSEAGVMCWVLSEKDREKEEGR